VNSIKKIEIFIISSFSFFLAFGKFDPFGSNSLYFNILTIMSIIVIYTFSNKKNLFSSNYVSQYVILLTISIFFLLSSIKYGKSFNTINPLNIKYILCISIYIFFSYEFSKDNKLKYYSILFFSISCGIISLFYYLGLFNNHVLFNNGRLLLFNENPNSISSRFSIGFAILYFNILNDPLKLGKKKYSLCIFLLPIISLIIDTGSRGSFIILIISFIFLTLLSKVKKIYIIIFTLMIFPYIYKLIENSSMINRFEMKDITGGREIIWSITSEIAQNNIFGIGEEGYSIEMIKIINKVKDPHNIFLYILVCGGIISLLLFMIFLTILIKKSHKQLLEKNPLPLVLLILLLFLMSKTGGVLTYLIMWYFLSYINSYNSTIININDK